MSKYSEYEGRFEKEDLAWMADYVIHNLVFCTTDLKLSNPVVVATIVDKFWEAFFNFE